ncbi:MAG: branched-chain amino acid ABC transporter permease [Archaeoglobaceae archaeon]
MVRLEARRGRVIIHLNRWKYEWTIEPRYWRNPFIGLIIWLSIPIFVVGISQILPISVLTLLSTLIFANILCIIAIPLTLQIIGTGRVNFGPHFFAAIGGYTSALLSKNLNLSPLATLPASFAVGALIALGLSPITIISRGLYFVLITLLLPFILLELAYWQSEIFGAETGIPGVPILLTTGNILQDTILYFYLSLSIVLIFLFISDRILRSRYGFLMGVINEDEEVAESYGINTAKIKIPTFTLTSGAMAIAGWFIAHYYGSFTGPAWLHPSILILILLTTTLGGKGAIYGVVISAYVIATLREVTRITFGELSIVVLFLILLLFLYILPEGFWGIYRKKRYREYYPSIKIRRG